MEEVKQDLQWWQELSHEDRARILVPFIQLQMFSKKPWKCDWQCESEELERLFRVARWGYNNKKTVDTR